MGTPGPTVHARKKLLKIVMHPTPNSLPIHSLQSLSLCLPQFLLMFDKWRLVTCLARDHVYMAYFLVSCLYCNFTDISLYLDILTSGGLVVEAALLGFWPCLRALWPLATSPCCLFTHTVPLMTHIGMLLLSFCLEKKLKSHRHRFECIDIVNCVCWALPWGHPANARTLPLVNHCNIFFSFQSTWNISLAEWRPCDLIIRRN